MAILSAIALSKQMSSNKKAELLLKLVVYPLVCLIIGLSIGFIAGQKHSQAGRFFDRSVKIPESLAQRLKLTEFQRQRAERIVQNAAAEIDAAIDSTGDDVQRISAACTADLRRVIGSDEALALDESEVRAILVPETVLPEHQP